MEPKFSFNSSFCLLIDLTFHGNASYDSGLMRGVFDGVVVFYKAVKRQLSKVFGSQGSFPEIIALALPRNL